jgi:hypothetical protein
MPKILEKPILFCDWCKTQITETTESQRYRHRKNGKIFCLKKCGYLHRQSLRTEDWSPKKKRPEIPCTICGKMSDLSDFRYGQYLKTKRAYCGRACSRIYQAQISSITLTKTNLKYGYPHMARNNLVPTLEARKKSSETLKAKGHKPKVQGGNGKPPTEAEALLFSYLSDFGFVLQPSILTPRPKEKQYPWCYKPDLGNFSIKLAIEADGTTHNGRKTLDMKKDQCLNGLGWTVLRFKNQEILQNTTQVIQKIMSTISILKD